jgi:hypothetical protein
VTAEQAATGGPIFIVGAMGSGTTLMRLILDSHEHIAIAQETGFMRAVLANKWIPFWKFGGEWYGRLGWSEDELNSELRNFYDRLFTRFAREQGKRRWGDKTPYHTWHMPEASRVFPDAVFVALVRHPGAVSLSLHQRFKYDWPKSVGHWVRSNLELLHRAEELGDRLIVCRYEDLVLHPEPVLREVLDWLDEPWTPRVLEHHKVHEERGTPEKVEGRTRSTDPIDVARITKWEAEMEAEGYEVMRTDADALARFFGYQLDDARALAPLDPVSGRTHLLTGEDLIKRQAALGLTHWGPWPRASMVNRLLQPHKLEVTAKKKRAKQAGTAGRGAQRPAAARTPAPVAGRSAAKAAFTRLPAPAQARVRALVKRAAGAMERW